MSGVDAGRSGGDWCRGVDGSLAMLLVLGSSQLQSAQTTVQFVQTLHVLVDVFGGGSGVDSQCLLHLVAETPGQNMATGGVIRAVDGVHELLKAGVVCAELAIVLAKLIQGQRRCVLLIWIPEVSVQRRKELGERC